MCDKKTPKPTTLRTRSCAKETNLHAKLGSWGIRTSNECAVAKLEEKINWESKMVREFRKKIDFYFFFFLWINFKPGLPGTTYDAQDSTEGSCWRLVPQHCWCNYLSPSHRRGTPLLAVTFALWIKASQQNQEPSESHVEEMTVWISLSVSPRKTECECLNAQHWVQGACSVTRGLPGAVTAHTLMNVCSAATRTSLMPPHNIREGARPLSSQPGGIIPQEKTSHRMKVFPSDTFSYVSTKSPNNQFQSIHRYLIGSSLLFVRRGLTQEGNAQENRTKKVAGGFYEEILSILGFKHFTRFSSNSYWYISLRHD